MSHDLTSQSKCSILKENNLTEFSFNVGFIIRSKILLKSKFKIKFSSPEAKCTNMKSSIVFRVKVIITLYPCHIGDLQLIATFTTVISNV